ncbi:MAG: hypothetical protein V1740_02780 [Candidatus Woesearchaeota archaeon]
MELIRIEKDKERAKSLLELAMLRYNKIPDFDKKRESSLAAESFYEVCKELITSILFIDGYKTLSHKDLIEYLRKNYINYFSEHELHLLDDLRKRRNKIVYYGTKVDMNYIERNQDAFEKIIAKLNAIIKKNLDGD